MPGSQDQVARLDYKLQHALNEIRSTYGDKVYIKPESLIKFGRNQNVGNAATGYTIWATGADDAHETYVAANTNSIDSVSSDSGSDTTTLVIEGHTETDSEKTFLSQSVTLTGQTRAVLSTSLNRVTRVYASGSVNLVGNIFVYENTAISAGKPSDTTKIHLTIRAGKNQSEKASTSLSNQNYWIITGYRGSVLEKVGSFADVTLQIRQNGKVFRDVDDITATDANTGVRKFNPYIIASPNSDIRLIAISDSTSRDVTGSIDGYLALVNE